MPEFIVLLLTFFPTLAFAEWQYTKWGMTQQDVIDASNGIAVPDLDSKGHSTNEAMSLLEASYSAGRFEFIVRFLFDKETRRLSSVHLNLKTPEQCNLLLRELIDKYGPPRNIGGIAGEWRDESSNNRIQFVQMPISGCPLSYTRLRGPINKGL
jgi:hypothetical protein